MNTGELEWPYIMQPGAQKLLAKTLAPQAPWKYIGYGGPKGGGKSFGARGMAFTITWKYPISVVLIRSRLTSLKRNHIYPARNELREFIQEGWVNYRAQDNMFEMPSGGMVQFMYAQNEADIDLFDGIAADLYIFEEAGHFTESMMKGIYKNNRPSDVAINRNCRYNPRSLFTFNWGGRGHSALRRWFWDGIYQEGEKKEDYIFLFADLSQNKMLLEYDSEYADRLKQLPKQLKEAYLTGDPDAFVGTMFTLIPEYHEVQPFHIPEDWSLISSLDPGTGSATSFGLYAKDRDGNLYKVLNYYQDNKNPVQHIETIDWMIRNCRWTNGRKPDYIVSDSFAFNRNEKLGIVSNDITWEDLFNKKGYYMEQVKYNPVTAIMALQTAIHFEFDDSNPEKVELLHEPKLKFFSGECNATIEEMRAAQRSETNPELIDTNSVDHAIDETKNMVLTAINPPNIMPNRSEDKIDYEADYGRAKQLLRDDDTVNELYKKSWRYAY